MLTVSTWRSSVILVIPWKFVNFFYIFAMGPLLYWLVVIVLYFSMCFLNMWRVFDWFKNHYANYILLLLLLPLILIIIIIIIIIIMSVASTGQMTPGTPMKTQNQHHLWMRKSRKLTVVTMTRVTVIMFPLSMFGKFFLRYVFLLEDGG